MLDKIQTTQGDGEGEFEEISYKKSKKKKKPRKDTTQELRVDTQPTIVEPQPQVEDAPENDSEQKPQKKKKAKPENVQTPLVEKKDASKKLEFSNELTIK